jgi:hypothetical protein
LLKLMLEAPAVAVTAELPPPQLLTMFGVLATTRLATRLSVKLASIGTALPLVMLKVIVLGTLGATVVGLKLLVIEGGCNTTNPILAVPPLEFPRPEVLAV